MVSGCGLPPAHTLRPRGAGLPSCPARGLVPCRPPLPGSPSLYATGGDAKPAEPPHDCAHVSTPLRREEVKYAGGGDALLSTLEVTLYAAGVGDAVRG